MSGYRQAAIALHAVGAADRRLILAELPAADRDTLTAYLRELKELGFDGADAEEVLSTPVPPPPAVTSLDRIMAASPATMFAIFRHEPASMVAQFLALEDWPWAPAMLELFPAIQRERIRAARPCAVPDAPARQRFVFDAVFARVDATACQQPQTRHASPLASLLRKVTSWTR
ncbi:hypothetical protein IGS59_25460 [Janthinobacterium sp. GW460P]|uniref:hypothetical protein n=1 Tax=unclassified Janthinobacterium TaxID=2610881 RepID=UPI000A321FC7|nr:MULTISPECIES: hypothetical protein [unclassified Janthinobacterium]MCC7705594.1 hypothetical protein [Janthinobacterium sp. GW460P]MCC7711096.1 hypothetical protein [Janthinobacterium sp. GW460W]